MELWWRIAGWREVRLTSADPLQTVGLLARQMELEQLCREEALSVRFLISEADFSAARSIAAQRGDRLETICSRGFFPWCREWSRQPLIVGFLALLTALSLWLPSRIFFFQVEGNQRLPAAQILEQAQRCGVAFGASAREIRSEQVKNRLLQALPQLQWVGVNTEGPVARISVRERDLLPPRRLPGSVIVAAQDAVIESVTATAGTAYCTVGQAVHRGQVLISGVTDLGICTRITGAEGEIFARTVHAISASMPRQRLVRREISGDNRSFSIVVGKKRINLYSDSGILHPGCGKMREAIPLVLPGGWRLPVTLVIECYEQALWERAPIPQWEAEALLLESCRRQILAEAVAGEILREAASVTADRAGFRLEGTFGCREMIGRYRDGVYLEDDAKDDRSSGERGAG